MLACDWLVRERMLSQKYFTKDTSHDPTLILIILHTFELSTTSAEQEI